MKATLILITTLVACASVGCGEDPPTSPTPIAEGIFGPMGSVRPSASADERALFSRGRSIALKRFTPETGLGPEFNVSFCVACHEKPTFGGTSGRYRDFSLVGFTNSGGFYEPAGVNGIQPHFTLEGRNRSEAGLNAEAVRSSIPFFGVGLLAEVSESSIAEFADPDDTDGDGISGRLNYAEGRISRFGRKAQAESIEPFIRGPLFNHAGITSDPLPLELRSQLGGFSGSLSVQQAQSAAGGEARFDSDAIADPELSSQELYELVAFATLLAAPEPSEPTESSLAGREYFKDIGCDDCHRPQLEAPRGGIPAYTDLLVHDMGEDMADGVPMGVASGSEFRTQPLWGVTTSGPYLHDGRADTLHEAIMWHGGEAESARDNYVALPQADQQALLDFLDSLGGKNQKTRGMLAPDAAVPASGEFGGPVTTLSGNDLESFVRGRQLFDQDFYRSEGLGPMFNGDSCRACHFDPVIGGAGPRGVNVIRQSGETMTPENGTMMARFSVLGDRPQPDEESTIFEQRQTPPIFGLGLVDQISDETIIALQDPEDEDEDGISGRARILSDGRIGRLGWKAGVPSLGEFARDAMSNEMGISVPAQDGLTFGFETDDDEFSDPEISESDLGDLVFFMAQLAPPRRSSVDVESESQGQALFSSVGCDRCHVPVLNTADGQNVELYSDLLLHDVAEDFYEGIFDVDVDSREFRTPPLWGLYYTAPYMHDGASTTIEDAILRHDSEADETRENYKALSLNEKAALVSFLYSL